MKSNLSYRTRATTVGILILLAYSMLTYSFTNNKVLGVITDIISGVAVIGIPVLMHPIFNSKSKALNYAYIVSRSFEGIFMIMGGVFILVPSLEPYREHIYNDIHIYFFISGALLLYLLLYRTRVVPVYLSIVGIVATVILFSATIIQHCGCDSLALQLLLLPTILTELVLAFWLIIKGFDAS